MNEGAKLLTLHQPSKDLWGKLIMDGKQPAATVSNVLLILAMDGRLKDAIAGDLFKLELVLKKSVPPIDDMFAETPGPYPRQLDDTDAAQVLAYVQQFYIPRCRKTTVEDALRILGRGNGTHPIREWLASLEWDGTKRIDSWLSQVYGVPLDDYHSAVGSKLLIAAVRRVRQPGCKFDQMVILEGGQGIGKSRSLAILFSPDWFTDQIASPASPKDAGIDMRGKWGIEFGEIDQVIRTDIETVKAFLSRGTDHFRAPFGRTSSDYPRQCVFVGTTNSDDYLRDHTGNRRFWPVRCRSVGSVDTNWLEEHREQLWAEAAARDAIGETVWLDDAITQQAAEGHQSDRLQIDPWHSKIENFINFRSRVEIYEILSECLTIPYAQQTKALSNRTGAILRILGWASVTKKNSTLKKTERFWEKVTQHDMDV